MFESVREELLGEGRSSPALLSDLAGLEQIVAESYNTRSFIELLQNADDAGASRFTIWSSNEFLVAANDGQAFTLSDLQTLCRSAASQKRPETSIGYRGIGFKSVVGITEMVHLLSGEFTATFSRERTAKEIPEATVQELLPTPTALFAPAPSPSRPATEISVTRWRSAEQQVLDLLKAQGWAATDVSRQNLGYDIEAADPNGEKFFVEVKSLTSPGQAFALTSNEEAVARQKGGAYRLALVCQSNTHLEVAFVDDPIAKLTFSRQCRQWVWDCSAYEFLPERFPLR